MTNKPKDPTEIDIYIGERITKLRDLHGVSAEQLATALGISQQQMQKYESGKDRVSASRLYVIACLLGTDVGYFYAYIPSKAKESLPTRLNDSKATDSAKFGYYATPEEMDVLINYKNLPTKKLKKKIKELLELLAKKTQGRKSKEESEDEDKDE